MADVRQAQSNIREPTIPRSMDAESIGKRIREIREALRKSVPEVAEAAGLQATFLEAVEDGKEALTVNMLNKIAEGLEVPAGELLGSLSPRALVVAIAFDKAPKEIKSALKTIFEHPWVKA